jgi:excisionase family DNA binding protein
MSPARTQLAYSRQEAADLYGVSFDTIRRAVAAKELKAKKVGNRYRISAESLREWFEGLEDA